MKTGNDEELQELRLVLNYIGGRRINGVWHFPFYQHEMPTVMMPVQEWISARKKAAEVLSRCLDGEYDNTSGEVLPDLDGQNLTD